MEILFPLYQIPLAVPTLEQTLNLSADEFKEKYGRDKPSPDQEVIFHCKLGGRAQTATDLATRLGYTKYVTDDEDMDDDRSTS